MFILLQVTGDERISILPGDDGKASIIREVGRAPSLAQMANLVDMEELRNVRQRRAAAIVMDKIETLTGGRLQVDPQNLCDEYEWDILPLPPQADVDGFREYPDVQGHKKEVDPDAPTILDMREVPGAPD